MNELQMKKIEKKFLASGKSIVDEKLAELVKIDGSSPSRPKQNSNQHLKSVPAIVCSEYSTPALEQIDEIFDSQNEKFQVGLPMIKEEIDYWVKANYLPCQMDAVMSLAVMDARRQQEKLEHDLTREDWFTSRDALEDLDKIKKRFNIAIDEDHFNSDQQLFKSFMSMDPRAFYNFKDNANISRTLVKNHLKPKVKTGIEKRKEEVIREHDQLIKNEENLKRMKDELQQLKMVNKGSYMVHKKEYNRVVQAQTNGLGPYQMALKIAALPQSYLPDEQDMLLMKTMNSYKDSSLSLTKSADNKPGNDNLNRLRNDDSILSFGVEATPAFTNNNPNDVSNVNTINVTDFTSNENNGQASARQRVGTLAPIETKVHSRNRSLMNTGTNSPTLRKKEKRTLQDIKLAEMHMKRRVPQLYLSKDNKEGKIVKMNDFNRILNKSLMSPTKGRYVKTRHEQELLDKSLASPRTKKPQRLKLNSQENEAERQDDDILPIISVGGSVNSVDYQNQKIVTEQQDKRNNKHLRLGERFRRGRADESADESNLHIISGLASPINSGPSFDLNQYSSALSSSRNLGQQVPTTTSSMRGVSPLIRGHLKSTSQNQGHKNFFMTNVHGDSQSSLRKMPQQPQPAAEPRSLTSRQGNNKYSSNNVTVKDGGVGTARGTTRGAVSSQRSKKKDRNSIHVPVVSPHQQSINDIILKVRRLRGVNPLGSKLKDMSQVVAKQELAQKFRAQHYTDTMNQVSDLSHYQPNILKWLFDEMQESLEDECETQRNAIKDFEVRKLDYKYFQMIENRERSNFNKQISANKKRSND